MRSCARCLYTTLHPLHLTIDQEGICSGCRVHEEKDILDWRERGEALGRILQEYRCRSGHNYDCIVPVSGGRDSYFIVHTIKKIYGMNPLLVTYNKQYNTAVGVRNLANLRIRFDCDLITQTVNPDTVRKITRATFRRFGSVYWHCLAGQTAYPVQTAVKLKIPLVIWGVHQGVDQVGMFSHLDEVEMSRKYRKEHDLMGYEAEDLISVFDEIKERDVIPYLYPQNLEIERIGVRGIYLSNYMRWDSRTQHEQMIKKYGYESQIQTRTFDCYNDADCWVYSDVHDYLKWIKHGYGKVTDHACREIRLNHMSYKAGIQLRQIYQKKLPKYLKLFCEWLNISRNSFHFIADKHRNSILWNRDRNWKWKKSVKRNIYKKRLKGCRNLFIPFKNTKKGKSTDSSCKYILIGKGKQ